MMTKQRKDRLKKKLMESRARLLDTNPFFAILLMYLKFVAVKDMKTMSTNGRCIYFSPDYVDKLYTHELDFILCHQVMHIAFGDIWRTSEKAGDSYHHACDIVINANLALCGWDEERHPHLGDIFKKLPGCKAEEMSADEVFCELPYSVSVFDERTRSRFMIDSDEWWDNKLEKGRIGEIIIDTDYKEAISDFSEELFAEAEQGNAKQKSDDDGLKLKWQLLLNMAIAIEKNNSQAGSIPAFMERRLEHLREAETDWRAILNDFIQEEISDYSFSPPDRRFGDSMFFLPDFNDKTDVVKDILFMIDTSASMSNEMITAAYSEVKGAIDQFGGKLKGWLGFFDMTVIEPQPFGSEDELEIIRPMGGGGTDFYVIFDYVAEHMQDNLPASIIILTDGYADFPEVELAQDIPVLWLLNNDEVQPPWGKVARIRI